MKKTGLFSALLLSAALSLSLFALPIAAADSDTANTTVGTEPDPEPAPIENSVFLAAATPLRAGSEVTFTFSCSGEGVRALQGGLTYDTSLLTYISASTLHKSWLFTLTDEGEGKLTYIGLSTEAEGASGVNQLFSLTFRLNADTVTGNSIPFYLEDATALKEQTELTFSGGACTFTVDRPLSDSKTLTALTVDQGTLAPAFDPSVTEYRLQVPYDCTNLKVDATPAEYATVEIGSTNLKVGNNTIEIKVTAESGQQQIYSLTVTRQPDPNYQPSADSRLSGVTLSDGILFPAFSPSITEYTVYIVNENTVTLTPQPSQSGSAEAAVLEAQDGAVCTITSIAEDGSQTVYTFKALHLQNISQSGTNQSSDSFSNRQKLLIALILVAAVTFFFVGFGVSSLVKKKKDPPTPTSNAPETADEKSNETPVEAPTETPDETSAETPDETPAEAPTDAPVETPAETPDEASAPKKKKGKKGKRN